MSLLYQRILTFNESLQIPSTLPSGVQVLNPFDSDIVKNLCEKFYSRYYHDNQPRHLILGINPGRLGGGLTGIPFTDPIQLQNVCGIANTLTRKAELSSEFIYRMIAAYGTPEKFYGRFLFGAVSPLGFTRDNKNLNYYDVPQLQEALSGFILDNLRKQIELSGRLKTCYCLGEGDNFKYLSKINNTHHLFDNIIPLPHPRFIMQYQRKRLSEFIDGYLRVLGSNGS